MAAVSAVAVCAAVTVPASAQYANEYSPPKLVHQGSTSKSIAGSGQVIVQVQVNADGTHKATRVLRSTNSGDNVAAMEIAQTSSYATARRGKTPVTGFYDFTLRFHGGSVAGAGGLSAANLGGVKGQIDDLIRAGNYNAAMTKAQGALANNPDDPVLNSELGAAQFFLNNDVEAASAFDKVPNTPKEFANVAAQAYQLAAAKLATSNPTLAVKYGQKAVQMAPNGGSYFALGTAQLQSGNASTAAESLKKSRDLAFADPKTDVKSRVAIDSQLMQAYMQSGDSASAANISNEIKKLDPGSDAAQVIMGNQYMSKGNDDSKSGNHQQAISDYEKAAQVGGSKQSVTAYAAAALEVSHLDKPDYGEMKGYADKALAVDPNDALALYAEGIAEYGQYVTGGSTNGPLKQSAVDMLNKAKSSAQAAGNSSLVSNISAFMDKNIK